MTFYQPCICMNMIQWHRASSSSLQQRESCIRRALSRDLRESGEVSRVDVYMYKSLIRNRTRIALAFYSFQQSGCRRAALDLTGRLSSYLAFARLLTNSSR